MARLTDLIAGTRAIKRVRYPLCNIPSELTEPAPELKQARASDIAAAGKSAEKLPTHDEVGLRVLLPGELADVLERARAYAKARGEENPDPDSPAFPIYNLGMQIFTLAAACVDPDCPRDESGNDRLYFGSDIDSGAENIQKCVHMTRDTLAYLCQQWEAWCDAVNPQASKVDFWAIVEGAAESADFLSLLRPGLLVSCTHTMAVLLASSPEAKSQFGQRSTTEPQPKPKKQPKTRGRR